MLQKLIKHSWLSFWRSPFVVEKIILACFKILFFFWIVVGLFGLLGISDLLLENGELIISIHEVGALLLAYLLFDWIIRFLLQSFPPIQLTPYLALPIQSSTIVNSLLLRSMQSIFFVLPFVILLPLNVFLAKHFAGTPEIISINLVLIASSFANHFLVLFVKYKTLQKQYIPYGFIGIVLLLTLLQNQGFINLYPVFIQLSKLVFSSIAFCLVPLIIAALLYKLMQNSLLSFLKVDHQNQINDKILPIQFFSTYGKIGQLVDFELNLLTRLKATRGLLLFSLFFIFYPIFVGATNEDANLFIITPFAGMFVSFGMVQIVQYALAWHTFHFDSMLLHVSPKQLVQAKWISAGIVGVLFSALAIVLYAFIAPWFIPFVLVGLLYNFAFTTPLTLYLGIKYPHTKNPYSSNVFQSEINFEPEMIIYGLLMMVGIVIPFAIGKLLFQSTTGGIVSLLVFAIGCLVFHKRIVRFLATAFQESKYKVYQKLRAFAND